MDNRYGWRTGLKGIAAIMTVLLAAGLGAFFWMESQADARRRAACEELEQELRPLELERHDLRQELDELEKEFGTKTEGVGSIVFLFTNLDEKIYTEIYPQMTGYGFRGVLTLSKDQLPGRDGCMSREQFEELTEAGWECCVRRENGEDFREWLANAGEIARKTEITLPEAVYYPQGAYSDEEDFLSRQGFQTAVHHGEEGRNLLITETGEEIWYPGAMPWSQKDAPDRMDEAISQKANLVFTVGTDVPEEEYVPESYVSMMEYMNRYCQTDELKVMTLSEAREYRAELERNRYDLGGGYREQKKKLEERIDELGREMDAVTEKYREEWE